MTRWWMQVVELRHHAERGDRRSVASTRTISVLFTVSMNTIRAPTVSGTSRLATCASAWNSGSTPRMLSASVIETILKAAARSASRFPCVSMTPLGSLVVPEV